MKNKPK